MKFIKLNFERKYILFTLALTLVFTFLFNLPYFYRYYGISVNFTQSMLAGFALTFTFWYILGLLRILFVLLTPILFLTAGAVTFFVFKYDLLINSHIIRLVFEADSREFSAFYEHGALLYGGFAFVLGLLFSFLRFKMKSSFVKKFQLVFVLIICGISFFAHGRLTSDQQARISMPFLYCELLINNMVEEFGALVSDKRKIDLTELAEFIVPDEDIIVVMVVGESLDSNNMHINGYERQTTPYMEKDGFISYKYALSSDTMTRESVPKMLSRNTAYESPDDSNKETGVTGVFRKLGFDTHWYSNQGRLRVNSPVGVHMKEARSHKNVSVVKDHKQTGSGHDFNIIPPYLDALKLDENKQFLVLHTFGSHWNYADRYPKEFEVFTPACPTFDNCPDEIYYNAYDNSVLYTDAFLHEVISKLQDKNAVVIYASDHGAMIKDKTVPHARAGARMDNLAVRHIGFTFWASDEYKKRHPDRYNAAASHKDKLVSGDYLFYSLLDCAGIESDIVDKSMSLCSSSMKEYEDPYFYVDNGTLQLRPEHSIGK